MSKMRLAVALFDSRPKVGGYQLHPLSMGRLALLQDRGNRLIIGASAGEELSAWVVYEVLMVAVADEEELVDLAMMEDEEWQREVKKFGFATADAVVQEFWEVMEAEMAAIRKARAVPKKKTAARKSASVRSGGRNT